MSIRVAIGQFNELTDERADRQRLEQLGRARSARDNEHVAVDLECVRSLPHLHAALGRAADELARGSGRTRHAVLAADHRAEHVVRA